MTRFSHPCLATMRASMLGALFFVTNWQSANAIVGRNWSLHNPALSAETIEAIASDGARLVAVGHHGEIWASDNGTTWTKQTSNTTANLRHIIYTSGPDLFVAVGDESVVVTSSDGLTWTAGAALGKDTLRSIIRLTDAYVAVGDDGNVGIAQFSTDAITWKRANPAAVPQPVDHLANAGGGNFCFALSGPSILRGNYSSGALSWTKLTGITGLTAADVPAGLASAGANLLLCTEGSSAKLWRSTNGTSWFAASQQPAARLKLHRLSGAPEAMGVGLGEVWTTTDGQNWTNRSTGTEPGLPLYGAGKLGSTYIVSGASGRILSLTPPGETSFTQRLASGGTTPLLDAASNGAGFVAVASGASATSADGMAWTFHTQTGLNMKSATHSGSSYVAAGDGIWTSPDGVTWTEVVAPGDPLFEAVRWLGNQLIAVGFDASLNEAIIYTSPTGVGWTKRTIPKDGNELRGVASLGGLIVAVGDNGLVLRSNNSGATWVKQAVALGNNESFTDITFGNNLLVATTDGGSVWTSPNGATWTKRKTGTGFALNRIIVAGNQIFAAGENGTTTWSFGGLAWSSGEAGTSQNLAGLAWNGTRLVTVGEGGTILSSGGGQPARPTLDFQVASSSVAENVSGGTTTITLNLAPPAPVPVTVLLTVAGTAVLGTTPASDYSVDTKPITFGIGDDTKNITVTVRNDKIDELNELAVFSLGAPTGDAALGTVKTHSLTIQDDDQIPVFTQHPASQFVMAGSPVAFTAAAQGSGNVSGVWKKNNGAAPGLATVTTPTISPPGATFAANLAQAALTHAGLYTVQAVNDAGKTLSTAAYLGVVENNLMTLPVLPGSNVILNVKASGTGLTYRWEKIGDGDLSNSTENGTSGATTNKLTLKDVGAGESGTYRCRVTMNLPDGSTLSQHGATTTVAVVFAAPDVTTTNLPSGKVAQAYDFTPMANGFPNKWTITGLPLGLTANSTSGRITGKPQQSGTFSVTLTPSNLVGTGAPTTLDLTIDPLPANAVGDFYALEPRQASLNKDLGARLKITIAASGSFSGSYTRGSTTVNLAGSVILDGAGAILQGSHAIPANAAAGFPATTLHFQMIPGSNLFSAGTTLGGTTSVMTAWANTWVSSPPVSRVSSNGNRYNFVVKPLTGPPSYNKPQGHSIGWFEIPSDGSVTVTMRLADNTAVTIPGVLGPAGQIAIYAGLYNNTGSVHGIITVEEVGASPWENNRITGDLTWSKAPQPASSKDRNYKTGFPTMTLATDGGRYFPVGAAERFLLITKTAHPNIDLKVSQIASALSDHPSDSVLNPNILFDVFPPPQNPLVPSGTIDNEANTTVNISNETGFVNGTFTYVDQDPSKSTVSMVTRNGTYVALAIRPNGSVSGNPPMRAFGYYVVPEKPSADFPPTTVNTSPIVSGNVVLEAQ